MNKVKQLLVLSIIGGRHFPKRVPYGVLIEARLDGELLTTEEVNHNADPSFNIELAWELDRKGFHFLRISRTPLKIQCLAVNRKTSVKESIGYIILDLRTAHPISSKSKWFPLLNCKYSTKPELLLSLTLEEDKMIPSHAATGSSRTEPSGTTPKKKRKSETIDKVADHLKPRLNEENGCYEFGLIDNRSGVFSFSVTVGFGANLEQLMPSPTQLPANHRGFFFYYSLMENDILTDTFNDLTRADFAPERATVQLRSSVDILREYFEQHPGIQIHLCCGEMSLGCTQVKLNVLSEQNWNDMTQPVTVESTYELKTSRHSQMMELPETFKPILGIVLALKKEDENVINQVAPTVLNSSLEVSNHSSDTSVPKTPPPTCSGKRQLHFPQTLPENLNNEAGVAPSSVKMDDQSSGSSVEVEINEPPPIDTDPIPTATVVEKARVWKPSEINQYDLSVELRTIKNLTIPTPCQCIVRYSYPYFGEMAPLMTHPVKLKKGDLVYLPNGYTVFSFATLPSQLDEIFRSNPIEFEVVKSDPVGLESVFGKAVLGLGDLLDQEKLLTVNDKGKTNWKKSFAQVLPVTELHSDNCVAEMQVVLTLANFGVTSEPTASGNGNVPLQPLPKKETRSDPDKLGSHILESGLIEQIAVELEQWKEWQEDMFLKQLKEKEEKHLKALMDEWTARETEREVLLNKKLTEYKELEDKLKFALSAIEKRERELLTSEAELQRLKSDLQSEYDRHVKEVKDSSRRLKEDCEHKIELERSRTKVLQDQCTRFQKQVLELEKKLETKEAEFQAYKDQRTQPEIRLQSELNLLQLDKNELERKINSLTKSKVHYKQQYGRCLKELARFKQAMQTDAQAQLKKQQQELEQMKLQLLAAEKQESLKGQLHMLQELKSDIRNLPRHPTKEVPAPDSGVISGSIPATSNAPTLASNTGGSTLSRIEESCLAHLIEEKETLLRTGVYARDNPIIMELDKQIKGILEQMKKA